MTKTSHRTPVLPIKATFVVAAYIRVSTEDQAESGLGMDAQRTRCKAMCQVKGWPEPLFYIDDGVSGTLPVSKRNGLRTLVADIETDKVDAVIISSLDRLGRRASIIINLVEEFRVRGVSIVSCKESFDTSTPHGQLMLGIFAVLAQFERDLVSQRTTDALAERGKRDGEKGGKLPYGYGRLLGCIVTLPDQAKIVRRIFAMQKRGTSLRKIGADVGKAHTSVLEILRHKDVYKGGKRGASDVHWPAILR